MDNKIDCTWLPAYAAGDLSDQDHKNFKQHLTQCSECEQASNRIALGLDQYRQSGHPDLPSGGLARLQSSLDNSAPEQKPGRLLMRYATAAMIALIFFASGFWSGRNTADQPVPTALHLHRALNKSKQIPDLDHLAFTVALAESIPRVFSLTSTIPR